MDRIAVRVRQWRPVPHAGLPLILIFLMLMLSFTACKVGPKYKTPTAPIPPTFKEQQPSTFREADGWKPGEPQDEIPRGAWWEMFGDLQLNALEEQVNLSNQTLAAAEAQFRAARAAIRIARSGLFPTVNVSANATIASVSAARQGPRNGSGSVYTLPVDFSYEADLWGRVRNTVQAQVATAQATAGDLETARLSIHSELAVAYMELRGLDDQQRLFDETVAAYERALELTTNRFNQGIVSGVDVAQAQTQLETARAQRIDLGVARAQFEHAIATLMGKPPADLTISPACTPTA